MTKYMTLFAVVSAASAVAAGSFDIAVRGRTPDCAIVRAADASPAVVYAAEELRDFTERMTGVRLAVVEVGGAAKPVIPQKAVFLNCSRRSAKMQHVAGLGDDGFRLKVNGDDLSIVGGGPRGVLYGVYELLERFGGCRWYASWHTVVPRLDAFSVPDSLDDEQKPAFLCRDDHWRDYFDGDFAARNRVNGGRNGQKERHGGDTWRFGGGLGNCHTFNTLLPPDRHFAAHPEWYSLVKGRRIKANTQLCLTNPDVLRNVVSNVLSRIRKDPGAKFYGVSQNDWGNWCECPACKAVDEEEGSHSGTVVRFVNAVAEAVEREFPDKIIETLAYQYTRKAPAKTKLRHNVVPCLCSFECDFSRPLDKSPYHQNVQFLDDLSKWGSQTDCLYVWDYVTDFCCYMHPFPNVYAMQANLKIFRDSGVKMLFEQGAPSGRHAAFAELKGWLAAKWMWNPDLPAEPLIADFFGGYYGKAARFVRVVFDEMHRREAAYVSADPSRRLWLNRDVTAVDCRDELDDGFIVWAQGQMRMAETAVKGEDPVYSYNVRMTAFMFDMIRLERLRYGEPVDFTGVIRCRPPAKGEMQELARSLLLRLDEAKDIRLFGMAGRDEGTVIRWKSLAQGESAGRRLGSAQFGTVSESAFVLKKRECAEVRDDPAASDGRAVRISGIHSAWCVNFFMDNVRFRPGCTYALKARVRAERKSGVSGNAFWAGVYCSAERRDCGKIFVQTDALPADGYQWYDVAVWKPMEGDYFWIGVGPFEKKNGAAVESVWLDELVLEERTAKPL